MESIVISYISQTFPPRVCTTITRPTRTCHVPCLRQQCHHSTHTHLPCALLTSTMPSLDPHAPAMCLAYVNNAITRPTRTCHVPCLRQQCHHSTHTHLPCALLTSTVPSLDPHAPAMCLAYVNSAITRPTRTCHVSCLHQWFLVVVCLTYDMRVICDKSRGTPAALTLRIPTDKHRTSTFKHTFSHAHAHTHAPTAGTHAALTLMSSLPHRQLISAPTLSPWQPQCPRPTQPSCVARLPVGSLEAQPWLWRESVFLFLPHSFANATRDDLR
jgi:hypothetical protein